MILRPSFSDPSHDHKLNEALSVYILYSECIAAFVSLAKQSQTVDAVHTSSKVF